MRRLVWIVTVFLASLSAGLCWARGGGGCLREGVLVLTPGGSVAVETLREGDTVLGLNGKTLGPVRVVAVAKLDVESYLEVSANEANLIITREHPVMVGSGEFRVAGRLRPGDRVIAVRGDELQEERVRSVRTVKAARPAYNLLVNPGGTFIPEGIVVHNKGCFLPDNLILKSDGTEAPISTVKPGDTLLAFTSEGRMVQTRVHNVLRLEVDEHVVLETDRETLRVTPDHPFYVGRGTFKTLEALRVGDSIIAWDGQTLAPQRILSMERIPGRIQVYNLQTDQPHTFFVGHLAVHNKGGCFPSGTPIATPHGEVPIESLIPGDEILALDEEGRPIQTKVKALLMARNTLMEVRTRRGSIQASPEHPVGEWDGGFRPMGDLHRGDRMLRWAGGRLLADKVRKVLPGRGEMVVFNLQVDGPHTFVAGGFLVHNKGGGCFPPGTPIRTPTGQTLIERLSPGDEITAVDPRGKEASARVESIHMTQAQVLDLQTTRGTLRATVDHPVELSDGRFQPAGELKPGSQVTVWEDGRLRPSKVVTTSLDADESPVYNLSVSRPHTFIASNFVVHNKGGSFHSSGGTRSSSGGGGGSSGGWTDFVVFLGWIGIIGTCIIIFARKARRGKKENLDFVYSQKVVARKAVRTGKLLQFLSRQDPSVSPDLLRNLAESTFRRLEECWQKREYGPMEPLLMPSLFAQHTAQIQGMIRDHEINRIEGLKVERVDLVNVRYTEKSNQREFTALISASARDHYVDDATGKFIRGDKVSARFQEFWTFQHQDDRWLLREIEQAGESEYLKHENFAEMLTDETLKGIYGEEAGKEGEAGPWLEKGVEKKATRIERMLNFLVQIDKLWDRQYMLERAREVFLKVYLARETGDPEGAPALDLFPQVADSLREQMSQWQKEGITAEYRNLCVRKVELIHVRNYDDRSMDEFTVRISAHAQRIVRKGGRTLREDPYVTDWEDHWTFGRLNEQWKLKEVLPPAKGKKHVAEENVDEDSSAGQLQWYYRQTRAN